MEYTPDRVSSVSARSSLASDVSHRTFSVRRPSSTASEWRYDLGKFVRSFWLALTLWALANVAFGIAMFWVISTYHELAQVPQRLLGHLTMLNIGIALLPVTRCSLWMVVLKVPYERAIILHRALGRAVFVFATLHGISWYILWAVNGIVMEKASTVPALLGQLSWLTMFIMISFAVEFIRRLHFEIFYYVHHLFLLLIPLIVLHSYLAQSFTSNWCVFYIVPGVFLWIIDRIIRAVRSNTTMRELVPQDSFSIDMLGATELKLHRGNFKFEPGQYCYINVPCISCCEWHPLSISSSPAEDHVSFLVRDMGPDTWSGKLYERVRTLERSMASEPLSPSQMEEQSRLLQFRSALDVKVDGPYGHVSLNMLHKEDVLFVCGGIGITPIMSILKDFAHCVDRLQSRRTHRHSVGRAAGRDSEGDWGVEEGGCVEGADLYSLEMDRRSTIKRITLVWAVQEREHLLWFGQSIVSLIEKFAHAPLEGDGNTHLQKRVSEASPPARVLPLLDVRLFVTSEKAGTDGDPRVRVPMVPQYIVGQWRNVKVDDTAYNIGHSRVLPHLKQQQFEREQHRQHQRFYEQSSDGPDNGMQVVRRMSGRDVVGALSRSMPSRIEDDDTDDYSLRSCTTNPEVLFESDYASALQHDRSSFSESDYSLSPTCLSGEYEDLHKTNSISADLQYVRGRPKLLSILSGLAQRSGLEVKSEQVEVLVCGPKSLLRGVEEAASAVSRSSLPISFSVHSQSFVI